MWRTWSPRCSAPRRWVAQTVYVPGKAAVPVAILAGIRHHRPETVAA
ncbi:hypothetical protein [Actinoplanes awajinensis]|nr:hypothetical protein [Actinoplanes awajinensis]